MEELRKRYILLQDRVGEIVERSMLTLGLASKSTPIQVLKGELLEALPETEQPGDSTRIALGGIDRKLRLECRTEDVTRLTREDADLLLAISSVTLRYQIYIDRGRLDFGKRLEVGSKVLVSVKGISKNLPGVIWYKGDLLNIPGTMFGVELHKNPGFGTSDGTFRNKRYFTCGPDSGVFVGLDKLMPMDDAEYNSPSKTPKRDEHGQASLKAKLRDTVLPSFLKGKNDPSLQAMTVDTLKIYQRVVTFSENNDNPVRGTVRFIGEEKDASGRRVLVGLELDERIGSGTGKWKGRQFFVCKRDYAAFVDIETVIPEKDFDSDPGEAMTRATSQKQDKRRTNTTEQGKMVKQNEEMFARSLSYDLNKNPGKLCKEKTPLRRANSFNSSDIMLAAGESSKTDSREFIEKQREMLDEFKSSKLSPSEDVPMYDIERTDSASFSDQCLNFHDKHFRNSPPKSEPITEQPRLSKTYHDFVNIDKEDYELLFKKDKSSDSEETTDVRDVVVTKPQLQVIADDLRYCWRELGEKLNIAASAIHHHDMGESHNNNCEKAYALLNMWVAQEGKDATVGKLADHLKSIGRSSIAGKLLEMHSDSWMDKNPKTKVVAEDVSSGTSNHDLLKAPSVNVESHSGPVPIDESQSNETTGVQDQMVVDVPHGYEVGTMVEVPMAEGLPRYGVIKWIGYLPQMKDKLVVGLELEEEQAACSDGVFHSTRYFTCPAGRGFFTLLNHCRQDSRFTPNSPASENISSGKAFGSLPSPVVEGITEPPVSLEDTYCGNMRGLQGHHNSCYLDATLYSMFAFSCVFDTLLHRRRKDADLQEYDDVQCVLRESIVNPLRLHGFVRADRVLQLRELLDKLSSTAGLINEEKDPEEFLNSLLQQVLKADPFLHLKSRDVRKKDGEGAYFYQIITDKDDSVKLAQVQQLLEQSFFSADIILAELPSCLILQMPRFGSRYKMYDMILPNLELDVSRIVESVPRECMLCGDAVATFECKRCSPKRMFGEDDDGIASYCSDCNVKVHSRKRADHEIKPLLVPRQFDTKNVPDKQKMELFAVVCIETSHYVAFVKCGTKPDSPWCFFDSMADRKGEKNGYNIPAVTRCPEALEWLSKDPKDIIAAKEKGEIPDKVRRLLGDGYLCMYQNLDMTMYK